MIPRTNLLLKMIPCLNIGLSSLLLSVLRLNRVTLQAMMSFYDLSTASLGQFACDNSPQCGKKMYFFFLIP